MRLEALAGWLSVGAAFIHGGVAAQHFAEWWGYGAFFVVASVCQAVFGLLLVTRGLHTPRWPWSRVRVPLFMAGIAGNVAIVALWAVTRTVGIPSLGPEAGTVEAVGAADAVSVLLEVLLVILLANLTWKGRPRAGAAAPAEPDGTHLP